MPFALGLDGTDQRGTRSEQEIEECLDKIFEWQAAPSYAYYLLDLPGVDMNLVGNNVGQVDQIAQRGGKDWRPYDSVLHPSAVIHLSVPGSMLALPPRYRFCVSLDSLGVVVPAAIANIVSASFVVGLVTRLMLRRFGDQTTGDYRNELNVIAATPREFVNGYGPDEPSFMARFQQVAQSNSIQASGLFLGWNAGGALSAVTGVTAAVWRLLHLRFDWRHLGELTAYGLSYCDGFAHVQSVLRAANMAVDAGQVAAPDQILAKMKNDQNISDLEKTIARFFDSLTSSFVTAAKTAADLQPVRNYSDYLQGYQRGSIRGATDIFATTLRVGYGLGYQDGFRIGYARGYSDGYKAGYRDGQDINWENVLKDIATIVSNAATIIEVFA